MQHIVAIVGNFGTNWHHFPVIARQAPNALIMFFDHRHTLAERETFARSHVTASDVASTEVLILDPPTDCTEGHLWRRSTDGDMATSFRCSLCGEIDWLAEPFPVEGIRVAQVTSSGR